MVNGSWSNGWETEGLRDEETERFTIYELLGINEYQNKSVLSQSINQSIVTI